MPISIKSEREISLMRESCRLLAILHEELAQLIRPGINTAEIDEYGEKRIREMGGVPSFLHYQGYPASICISVNEEIVHGIPKRNKRLAEGDVVSLDAGILKNGFHSDAARTYIVGEGTEEARTLLSTAEECFWQGVSFAKAGHYLHEISAAIGDLAESRGFGVIHELCGHGVGRDLHEDPAIPNYRQTTKGIRLRPGMTLAIEPMICAGRRQVQRLSDGWTFVTADRSPAAHYENTVLITEGEPEILTLRSAGK